MIADIAEIDAATLIARALGGEVGKWPGGVQAGVPGIGHSPRDRSVSILFSEHFHDGFWVTCFGYGDPLAERQRVNELLACHAIALPAGTQSSCPAKPLRAPDRNALWMFDEARHPAGTRVEKYLAYRGLTLPPEAAGTALRYHPAVRFDGERVPAMIALVRDIKSDRPRAIHRTALSWGNTNYDVHGKKRMALGPTTGGAVKLWPDKAVGSVLGVGEGIESTLSLRLVSEFGDAPVWALLNTAGLANFPVLAAVQRLVIAVDHDRDGAGGRAAEACARRWLRAGREIVLIKPKAPGADLNDLAREDAS